MAVFGIVFEFAMRKVNSPRSYSELFEALKNMDCKYINDNVWFIAVEDENSDAGRKLRNMLMTYLHSNDQLFVMPIEKWYGFSTTWTMNWINQRITVNRNKPADI